MSTKSTRTNHELVYTRVIKRIFIDVIIMHSQALQICAHTHWKLMQPTKYPIASMTKNWLSDCFFIFFYCIFNVLFGLIFSFCKSIWQNSIKLILLILAINLLLYTYSNKQLTISSFFNRYTLYSCYSLQEKYNVSEFLEINRWIGI